MMVKAGMFFFSFKIVWDAHHRRAEECSARAVAPSFLCTLCQGTSRLSDCEAWAPWAGLQGLGQEEERPDDGGGEGKEGSRCFPSGLHKGKEGKAVGPALLIN